jgi:hypothetical protein
MKNPQFFFKNLTAGKKKRIKFLKKEEKNSGASLKAPLIRN